MGADARTMRGLGVFGVLFLLGWCTAFVGAYYEGWSALDSAIIATVFFAFVLVVTGSLGKRAPEVAAQSEDAPARSGVKARGGSDAERRSA